jgi:hypothetical protein
MPLEAYASATSVYPGETIVFHASATVPATPEPMIAVKAFSIEILRKGRTDELKHQGQGTAAATVTSGDASEYGCNWPASYSLVVPADWRSGAYVAFLTPIGESAVAEVSFVVKASPATASGVLVVFPVSTLQAYNAWGGRSLYTAQPGRRVSFDRPTAWLSAKPDPLIVWLETHAPPVDYATSTDLHADAALLSRYRLLVSVWHDEYWSPEMRWNVEAFARAGGNVCFFSGNTCWWQVRFEPNPHTGAAHRIMVCYKGAKEDGVGANSAGDTTNWYLTGWPEEATIGVSSRFAALAKTSQPSAFTVRNGAHWVFDGTFLSDGDEFGGGLNIVGYECDGVDMAGHMQVLYREDRGEHAELNGWLDPGDLRLAGDFMGIGHDQVLFINCDRAPGTGRVMVADFSQGPPVRGLYWENWDDHAELDGWHDEEDLRRVGDFMGLGRDQVLFINRAGGGGRVLIADFSQGPPVRGLYWENWGDHAELDGWHDPEDLILVGDFMGAGHDQVLLINRDPAPGAGRVMIADFSRGPPIRQWYLERYGDRTWLDGWDGDDCIRLTGNFLGVDGSDQVLFISRDRRSPARVQVVDFRSGTPVALYLEEWHVDNLLDGWHDPEDRCLGGYFRGASRKQEALFINRTRGGGRVLAAYFEHEFLGPRAHVHYWEDWGDSHLLDGWHDGPEDLLLAGDFMRKGCDQVMFLEQAGGPGRVLIASAHKALEIPVRIKNSLQSGVQILATADLWSPAWGSYNRLFPIGTATMSMFTMNPAYAGQDYRGKIFSCGTTDWLAGLGGRDDWNAVSQITLNLLTRLG